MNFLTVSCVAATRPLPGSVSAGTAISIGDHSQCCDWCASWGPLLSPRQSARFAGGIL
jgi:hypothetical protein